MWPFGRDYELEQRHLEFWARVVDPQERAKILKRIKDREQKRERQREIDRIRQARQVHEPYTPLPMGPVVEILIAGGVGLIMMLGLFILALRQ